MDPEKRLSVEEALTHPWLNVRAEKHTNYTHMVEHYSNSIDSRQPFNSV